MNHPFSCAAGILAAVMVSTAAAADRAAIERGRQLFTADGCVHCHGSAGQGSAAGARLAPGALPAGAIAAFIRATNTRMPTYSARLLVDADVADIAAFLASIKASRPADSIPGLRALSEP